MKTGVAGKTLVCWEKYITLCALEISWCAEMGGGVLRKKLVSME